MDVGMARGMALDRSLPQGTGWVVGAERTPAWMRLVTKVEMFVVIIGWMEHVWMSPKLETRWVMMVGMEMEFALCEMTRRLKRKNKLIN